MNRPAWLDEFPTGSDTVRMVATCSRCKKGHAVDIYAPWASSFHALAANGVKGQYVRCECGRGLTMWRTVQGRHSAARKCDARCTSAKGHNCECQCSGANHGADNLS